MREIKWIFVLLIGVGAVLFGCNSGIIPVQPAAIPNLTNPLVLYNGTEGTVEFPFSLQVWQNSGSGSSCGGQGVSAITNFSDTAGGPYTGNHFDIALGVVNYGACYPFADWVFLTNPLPPAPAPQYPAPKDFSSGNYSIATFYAKSGPTSLTSVASGFSFLQNYPPPPATPSINFTSATLTPAWAPITVTLPPSASVTAVGIVMVVEALGPSTSVPYTIYMDNLQFQ